ncbi:hypothetical protein SAY87_011035 [Trapa incisa]|uniref:Uncharacterized protein n=1 Tax=Trapa incisa TaxID=236973 RepID=A0AAN7GQB6_9MYRT|nr:hypothetical protein SAY87_011035 [Trapa incisa]
MYIDLAIVFPWPAVDRTLVCRSDQFKSLPRSLRGSYEAKILLGRVYYCIARTEASICTSHLFLECVEGVTLEDVK